MHHATRWQSIGVSTIGRQCQKVINFGFEISKMPSHKMKSSSMLALLFLLSMNHQKQVIAVNEHNHHHLRASGGGAPAVSTISLPTTTHQQAVARSVGTTSFQQIRIHLNTDELEDEKGDRNRDDTRIDALIDDILPKSVKIWSEALSVRPLIDPVILDSNECGGVPVPSDDQSYGVENVDLVIYVGPEDDCSGNTFARAGSCMREDEFGRPIAGKRSFILFFDRAPSS